jgi:hypothetical protein
MASILPATVDQIVMVVAYFVKWSEGRQLLHADTNA